MPPTGTLRRLVLGSSDQTYTYLLASLVLFLGVTPFLPQRGGGMIAQDLLLVLVLVAATYNISQSRAQLWIGAAVAVPAAALHLVHAGLHPVSKPFAAAAAALAAAFFGYVLVLVLADLARGGRSIAEKVRGAIVAYLIIGLLWALLFVVVELLDPGSFSVPDFMLARIQERPEETPLSIFLYYSFVTLTTLGYGDVIPVGDAARTLSWTEAVFGQLFIAVTVARLVGMQVSLAGARAKPPES